jgi:hypothetical protein
LRLLSRFRFSDSSGVSVCTARPRSSLELGARGGDVLVLELADLDRVLLRLLVADDLQLDGLPDAGPRDEQRQLRGVDDRLAVELDDDVALLEPDDSAGPFLHDVGDERALRVVEAERLGDVGRHLLDHHAEPAARDVALVLQLRDDLVREVDRDREADADVAAAAAEDRGVDADDLALRVEQRAARVARIDGGVGLDEVVVRALIDVAGRSR